MRTEEKISNGRLTEKELQVFDHPIHQKIATDVLSPLGPHRAWMFLGLSLGPPSTLVARDVFHARAATLAQVLCALGLRDTFSAQELQARHRTPLIKFWRISTTCLFCQGNVMLQVLRCRFTQKSVQRLLGSLYRVQHMYTIFTPVHSRKKRSSRRLSLSSKM